MRFCTKCGQPVEPEQAFCTACGTTTGGAGGPRDIDVVQPVRSGSATSTVTHGPSAPQRAAPPATVPSRRGPVLLAAALLVATAAVGTYLVLRSTDAPQGTPGAVVVPSASGSTTPGSSAPSTPSPEPAPTPSAPSGSPGGLPRNVAASALISVPGTAPNGVDAAGHVTSYAAENLVDDDPTTAWRVRGDATGGEIVFDLGFPARILAVGLVNGYAKVDPASGADRYTQERRVTRVSWLFPDGTVVPQSLADDTRILQAVRVPSDPTVDRVVLRIDGTTEPGVRAYDYTALSSVDIEGQ